MFTGIIKNLGKVKEKGEGELVIRADRDLVSRLQMGDSISINGICLTIVKLGGTDFGVDFVEETAKKTNIGKLKKGDLVNLELPATPATFLSGHIVQGHVDGTARLESIKSGGNSRILKFIVPASISMNLIEKGSICVNGVSLTIIEAEKDYFTVSIIPHTRGNTSFKQIREGDIVNIEVDILAKYIRRLSSRRRAGSIKLVKFDVRFPPARE